jgi:beta-lactam-binding protein with PASTA domain
MDASRIICLAPLVALLVALAPVRVDAAPRQVTVPDVIGQPVNSAEARIHRAGLTVRLIGPSSGEGRRFVRAQNPAAGAKVRSGAQVRLTFRWVSDDQAPPSGPDASRRVRVPRVIGMSPRAAVDRLQRAGLAARLLGDDDDEKRRVIVSQHPAAGASVKRGLTVRIVQRHVR